MKILLINPPFLDVYKGFKAAAKLGVLYPPTGLLYIASSAIKAGHEVSLIDVDAEELSMNEIVQKAKIFNPDVIGITATTPTYVYARNILKEIKKELNVITVMGGIHITIMMDKVFEEIPELDFGVYKEGEITFVQFMECLEKNKSLKTVKGLIFRDRNGSIRKTLPRELINDLDSILFPERKLLKKERYLWSVPKKGVQEVALFITKRGCPFNCKFCSAHSMFGRRVRFRSIKNVIDEIEDIVKEMGINHIINVDDTLILNRERMVEFCQEIKRRNLVFTWEGMARANIIDPEILRMMREIGLVRLSFGIESGDQKILDSENKGITLNQIRNAYRWAKDCGIETRGSAIIGHPRETQASVLRTIKFLRSLKHLDQVYINIMVPYPGTEVYEIAKNQKCGMRLLCKNFSEFVRYDNSVIEVNNLTRKKLIFFQKLGLLYFYSTPRRILYNIKRAGIKTGLKNALAFIKGILGKGG